ncbi:hypothetical protein SUGI_1040490 [Cryptomeria japonica]|nr:hypothetical protein SUGI_1040490 [Cryptomeria japonica]
MKSRGLQFIGNSNHSHGRLNNQEILAVHVSSSKLSFLTSALGLLRRFNSFLMEIVDPEPVVYVDQHLPPPPNVWMTTILLSLSVSALGHISAFYCAEKRSFTERLIQFGKQNSSGSCFSCDGEMYNRCFVIRSYAIIEILIRLTCALPQESVPLFWGPK